MVKKITVYTAFGQFLEMVELQAEREMEQMKELDTDCYPLDHPLSDYQNALHSGQDLRVQSCPADFSVPVVLPAKRSNSCPVLSFSCSADPKETVDSPVPTTVETKKLNEATDMMMSFWKVHVTTRSKTEKEDRIASIFEKIDGLFSEPSTTSVASMFGKFEEFIEEMKNENKPTKSQSLIWYSPNSPSIPQLPVFVKSPIDSLKLLMGSNYSEMADNELAGVNLVSQLPDSANSSTKPPTTSATTSPLSRVSMSTSTFSSSTSTIVSKRNLSVEIRLQRAVIEKQKKIIDGLYSLQCLNQRLAKIRKEY